MPTAQSKQLPYRVLGFVLAYTTTTPNTIHFISSWEKKIFVSLMLPDIQTNIFTVYVCTGQLSALTGDGMAGIINKGKEWSWQIAKMLASIKQCF